MNPVRSMTTAAVAAMVASNASAITIDLPAVGDNTLYEDTAGALSNGAGSAMFAGNNSADLVRRALVRFDVAGAIPAGSTITAATLSLFQSGANAAVQQVEVHRVLAGWGEGASVAPSGGGGGTAPSSGDATWIHREFNSLAWATPGGDFSPAASAVTGVGGIGAVSWMSAALTADVQAMLDAPLSDFGWILLGNESVASSAKRFATREEAQVSERPVLRVEYVVPSPGPMAIVAVAFTAGMRRRDRRP